MHEVLVNCLGDLSLPRKSVVRLTDHPDMTIDVYRGRKTTQLLQMVNCVAFVSGMFSLSVYGDGVWYIIEVPLYAGLVYPMTL